MRRSRLYFAVRSPRAGAPDLIWPQPLATAKYNRLLRIEEELGAKAQYAGRGILVRGDR